MNTDARLMRLEALVSGARQSVQRQKMYPIVPPPVGEWSATTRTGGTYTPGADWNIQFDAWNVTYRYGKVPAGGGHLQIINNGNTRGHRYRIVFESKVPWSPTMIVELNGGTLQVQDNGRIQETSATGTLGLVFYEGRNVLEIMANDTVNFARVLVPAIDHSVSKWVQV